MKNKLTIPLTLLITISIVLTECTSSIEKEIDPSDTTAKAIFQYDSTTAFIEDKVTKSKTDSASKQIPLTITVNKLASNTAPVVIGIYHSKKKFLSKGSRIKEYTFSPKGNSITARITDMKYGEMAIAIYQDMNNNGELDRNRIGLPTEGYAFSNNFRPRIKAPEYNDCKFTYSEKLNTITSDLIK